MKGILVSGLLFAAMLTSALAVAAPAAVVTNGSNDGPGSLRAALGSGATTIAIAGSVTTITVTDTLEYSGTASLRIAGSGQIIDGSGLTDNSAPIFAVTQGADLAISNLAFDGGGGYDFSNPGGGKGIFVDVPEERTGIVRVLLTGVSVFGTGNHGVHVSDCSLGDDCGGGGGGDGDGSVASIYVRLNRVLIDGVGFGKQDADGVRVDDRNDGDIIFKATNSRFLNVGADGVELDEGNSGDVLVDVRNTVFEANGAYCLADDPLTTGGPCDDEGDPDVDDGFDIDEAGPGSLIGSIRNVVALDNFDEGLDFDEEDEGGVHLVMTGVDAVGNEDEGIKVSEENGGGVEVSLRSVNTADNNGSKEGIEIEEADAGDVLVTVNGTTMVGGNDEKLKIEQGGDPAADSTVKVRGSSVVLELDGVTEI